MGVMLSAAGSLQWYRDALAPGMSFDELLREADGTWRERRGSLALQAAGAETKASLTEAAP